jgi:predicted site-specific integrase-resolvase
MDGTSDTPSDHTVAYARVSGHGQKPDLERQIERLKRECKDRHYTNLEVIADLGSGLNFAKRGLRRLIGLILRRQIKTLVVMHKDRLLRFGAELIFEMCRIHNIKVVVIEDATSDVMSTLAADVIELMTVFSARMHGARSHKNKIISS